MTKLAFFILSLFTTTLLNAQSISPDGPSIGFIVFDHNVYSGTGFVLNDKRQVVTCAHVIDTTKSIFYVSGGLSNPNLVKHKLKLIKLLPEYDLALLESDSDLCNRPLLSEKTFNFTAHQHLFYLGYNFLKSNDTLKSLQANNAYVSSVGKTFEGSTIVDFIEFIGVGIPGYSGGPVINDEGKVVGIMREAWFKQGVKGGKVLLINRAYSIIPITKFQ